jgi:uncharacterized membrane protein
MRAGSGVEMTARFRKIFIIKLVAVVLLGIAVMMAVSGDYAMYSTDIARVTSVAEESAGTRTGVGGDKEEYTLQHIRATLMNGANRGAEVTIENKYGKSLVYTEKYEKGDEVFVTTHEAGTGASDLTADISGVKRDRTVALVFVILFGALFLVGSKKGIYTILSLAVNITIFYALLRLYDSGTNLLFLSVVLSVAFCGIVLLLVNGWNRMTLMSFAATLMAAGAVCLLSSAVILLGPQLNYTFLDFIPEPYTQSGANLMFISEILMGGLGVIMDIAVTITASATELIKRDPGISRRSLAESCRAVSDDITGTMINLVFFTNVAAAMPLFILSMRNDISFVTVIKNGMYFECARFLTGSIGIIITVPLSILAAEFFLRKTRKGGEV